MDAILTGKLRLIDQSSDPAVLCDVCEGVGDKGAGKGTSATV